VATSDKEHSMTILQGGLAAVVVLAASPLSAQSVMDEPRQGFDLATVTCSKSAFAKAAADNLALLRSEGWWAL